MRPCKKIISLGPLPNSRSGYARWRTYVARFNNWGLRHLGWFWGFRYWFQAYPCQLPHYYSGRPWGVTSFTPKTAKALTSQARRSPNGVCTFFMGVLHGLYVADNRARQTLIQESHIGVTSDPIRNWTQRLLGNHLMVNFLIWQNCNSTMYKTQRRFLIQNFLLQIDRLLPTVRQASIAYFEHHRGQQFSLKKFVFGLILRLVSFLPPVSLTDHPLDDLFFTDPDFQSVVYSIARYGVSERGNPQFESKLSAYFDQILSRNWAAISGSKSTIFHTILESRGIGNIPSTYADFEGLDPLTRRDIAMNYLSIVLGAAVHTTACSLDWLLAHLGKNGIPFDTDHLVTVSDDELDQKSTYETRLKPIRDEVISNIIDHPVFTHELFWVGQAYNADLPDGTTIHIPQGGFVLVNYLACNRRNPIFEDPTAKSNFLGSDTPRIAGSPHVSSFGGSVVSAENPHSRKCPGRVSSLYEKMMLLSILFRDYDIEWTDIKLSEDAHQFPVHAREDCGKIKITKKV